VFKNTRDNGLSERRKAASDAKAELLKKYKDATQASAPQLAKKLAERQEIAAARQARQAQREIEKAQAKALAEKNAAENAEREAAEALMQTAEREALEKQRREDALLLEAQKKAERDARYASRKARKS
jgi:uncharacterized protein (DUF1501 family)